MRLSMSVTCVVLLAVAANGCSDSVARTIAGWEENSSSGNS